MKKKNILKTFAIGLLCFMGVNNANAATLGPMPFDVIRETRLDHIYKVGDTITLKIERNSENLDTYGDIFNNNLLYDISDGVELLSCTGNITCDSKTKTIVYDGTPLGTGNITFKITKDEDQFVKIGLISYDKHFEKNTERWEFPSYGNGQMYKSPVYYVESNDPNKSSDSSLEGINFYSGYKLNGNIIDANYFTSYRYTESYMGMYVPDNKTIFIDMLIPFWKHSDMGEWEFYINTGMKRSNIPSAGTNEFTFKVISENRKSVTEYVLRANQVENQEMVDNLVLNERKGNSKRVFKDVFLMTEEAKNMDFTIKDKNGNIVDENSIVTTGMQVTFNDNTHVLVVSGDLTGTGNTGIADIAKAYQHLKGKIKMDDIYVKAGDVAGNDGEIKITDVTKLYQFMKNKIDTLK